MTSTVALSGPEECAPCVLAHTSELIAYNSFARARAHAHAHAHAHTHTEKRAARGHVGVSIEWVSLPGKYITVSKEKKKNSPPRKLPPPSVKMAVAVIAREAGLRLRDKFGGEDGG